MTAFVDGHVHLTDRDVILAAASELVGENADKFRATVAAWPEQNPPGPAKWSIEVNDWQGNTTRAELGDHLVLTYGRILRLSDAEYQDLNS
jgi:hypothetical protein